MNGAEGAAFLRERIAGDGLRFYVWRQGWVVHSAWRAVPPDDQHYALDCTDMDDGEFEAMMAEYREQEHANTAPGHPGDPGYF